MHTTKYIRDALGKALLPLYRAVCEHNMLYAMYKMQISLKQHSL